MVDLEPGVTHKSRRLFSRCASPPSSPSTFKRAQRRDPLTPWDKDTLCRPIGKLAPRGFLVCGFPLRFLLAAKFAGLKVPWFEENQKLGGRGGGEAASCNGGWTRRGWAGLTKARTKKYCSPLPLSLSLYISEQGGPEDESEAENAISCYDVNYIHLIAAGALSLPLVAHAVSLCRSCVDNVYRQRPCRDACSTFAFPFPPTACTSYTRISTDRATQGGVHRRRGSN